MTFILFMSIVVYFVAALFGFFFWGMCYPSWKYWNIDKRREHVEQWPIWTLLWPFGMFILLVKFIGLSLRSSKKAWKKVIDSISDEANKS